ncbi:bifunctional [glutamate--ammonia ligase]-adenylyl-L-tyrosine phosphorylase/[glutamate--ammonia-ligase] adenylyltransferase, partial [Massilia cavernae]
MSNVSLSRFYQRWVASGPGREERVAEVARHPVSKLDLERALAVELEAGIPAPRAMRRLRNLVVASLIRRDLEGHADLAEVVDTMTGLADFAIRTHLAAIMAEMVECHGTPVGNDSGQPQEMMVLAMGKQGGGELNVSSDIDLIFVYPEDGETAATLPGQRQLSNHEFFNRLGKKLIAALSEIIEDGFTFRVDMALRPNGASGPLVASLNMVEEYLIVQGREWERYAWVKARAVTGRQADIDALDAVVRPFVYRRYLDFGVIDAIRNMHAQIRAEVNRQERLHPDRSNNVKLGRGGIREIEFLAQVFQLIRGGRDAALRDRSTRATLRLLADKELMGADTVARLLDSYTFLRNLEHRLQYLDDAQTHTLPARQEDRQAVARMMGMPDVATLLERLDEHRVFVAAQFDAIFSDKSEGDGSEPAAEPLDMESLEAVEARLAALGFDDPAHA